MPRLTADNVRVMIKVLTDTHQAADEVFLAHGLAVEVEGIDERVAKVRQGNLGSTMAELEWRRPTCPGWGSLPLRVRNGAAGLGL